MILPQYLNLLNTSESWAFLPGSFCFDFLQRPFKEPQKMSFLYIFLAEKSQITLNDFSEFQNSNPKLTKLAQRFDA